MIKDKFGNIVKTPEQMKAYLHSVLSNMFLNCKVDFAYLGGSWATKNNQWWSDIDIFISLPNFKILTQQEKGNTLLMFTDKVTSLLEIDAVDTVVMEQLPLHIQFDIIKNGLLIFERNKKIRIDFIERLLPKYYDHFIWYRNLISLAEKHHLKKGVFLE